MSTFPSHLQASGIWTLAQQRNAEMGSNWPLQYPTTVEYLIVAGGGAGGGSNGGGGGGAGGYLAGTAAIAGSITYTLTIGAGGGWTYPQSNNGAVSTFNGITAVGGGGGGGEAS